MMHLYQRQIEFVPLAPGGREITALSLQTGRITVSAGTAPVSGTERWPGSIVAGRVDPVGGQAALQSTQLPNER